MERLSKDEVRKLLEVQKEVINGITYIGGVEVKKLKPDPRISEKKTGYEMSTAYSNSAFASSAVKGIINDRVEKRIKRQQAKKGRNRPCITCRQMKEAKRLGLNPKKDWTRRMAARKIFEAKKLEMRKQIGKASGGSNLTLSESRKSIGGKFAKEVNQMNKYFKQTLSDPSK